MKNKKSQILFILFIVISMSINAQVERNIVQFSGLVVAGDSLFGIQGVHVINKSSRVGYISSESGYFSFPAKEQDTILFSFVGFKKEYVVIPSKCKENKLTKIVNLEIDTVQLDMIEVLPYPTVELFKEAFVHLKLPEDKLVANMNRNLDEKMLRRMFEGMDMTASMNYKNYTQAQIERFEKPGFVATSQIFNPFAWIALIKAIKNGDFKREDDE